MTAILITKRYELAHKLLIISQYTQQLHNPPLPLYLSTVHDNDLTIALMKAQRLERRAEQCLVNKHLKRICIEKELYHRIGSQAGRRLHAANVNIGVAYSIRQLAGATDGIVECMKLDGLDDSDISASSISSVDLEIDYA